MTLSERFKALNPRRDKVANGPAKPVPALKLPTTVCGNPLQNPMQTASPKL